MKARILSRSLMFKCGHTANKDYLQGRLESAVSYAKSTRCINCFNTQSLRPALTLVEGCNVWVESWITNLAFGVSGQDFIECTIVRILEDDEIIVRLLESAHAGSNFTVNTKYVSQY
jgi:hypothetical protein